MEKEEFFLQNPSFYFSFCKKCMKGIFLVFCLEISYPVEMYKNVSNLCYKNVSFKIRFFWGFPLNFSGEYGKLLPYTVTPNLRKDRNEQLCTESA